MHIFWGWLTLCRHSILPAVLNTTKPNSFPPTNERPLPTPALAFLPPHPHRSTRRQILPWLLAWPIAYWCVYAPPCPRACPPPVPPRPQGLPSSMPPSLHAFLSPCSLACTPASKDLGGRFGGDVHRLHRDGGERGQVGRPPRARVRVRQAPI